MLSPFNRSRALWYSSAVISPAAKRRARMSRGDSRDCMAAGGPYGGIDAGCGVEWVAAHTTSTTKPTRTSGPTKKSRAKAGWNIII